MEKIKAYWNKLKEWADAHPYAAAGSVAGLLFIFYYLFSKLFSSAEPLEQVQVSSKPTPPQQQQQPAAKPTLSNSIPSIDIAQQRQQALTELNNQAASARESLKSSLQSSSVNKSGVDSGLIAALGKLAQGFFDNKIDTKLKTDIQSGALPASVLAGGSPKGIAAGVLDEILGYNTAGLAAQLPDLGKLPAYVSPFSTTGGVVVPSNYQQNQPEYSPYVPDTPYNFDPYMDGYNPSYTFDPYADGYSEFGNSFTFYEAPAQPEYSFNYNFDQYNGGSYNDTEYNYGDWYGW